MKIGRKMKMQKVIDEILKVMSSIEYGFKDENGNNLIETDYQRYENEFFKFYYLQTPEELLKSKCGVCWDQVELERKLFSENHIKFSTYFIYIIDNDMCPSHTFLTYEMDDKHYWFEHSWGVYAGVHEYGSKLALLKDVKGKFKKSHDYVNEDAPLYVFEYEKPRAHITCDEFYQFVETQKLVKLNEPLYFYHIFPKNVYLDKGLISLQYMYDNGMYGFFDKNVLKYKKRITDDWNIAKYKGKEFLTREEYIDALNIFRGEHGSNYIYFFRYPPYKDLGPKMKKMAKYKDIYRININDEALQKVMIDIFYGHDLSNGDNKSLNKKYYETVTKEEYFSRYDDQAQMNFANLNHIGISFRDGYCPKEFLEKIEWE